MAKTSQHHPTSRRRSSPPLDRHTLYELTVQSPRLLVPFLRAIHGGDPKILGEDFCGTAALSCAWVKMVKGGSAIAVDHDKATLARAGKSRGLTTILGDVRTATTPKKHPADLIFVGNFSIGELHTRKALLAYVRHARARLRPGGVFICDTYGGESAFTLGSVQRDHPGPDGLRIRYTWQQRAADPTTGLVENAIHFRVFRAREVIHELTDAFIYHWRLWSVPELRDALAEAGFASTEVYTQLPDAIDAAGAAYVNPVKPGELDDSFIVCVAGRV
jgi:SAM-dependent methyltransferase